ncbi:GyrI-like domain-containing protein [Paenibacillus sp. GCM10023252]|uniref:GyrI-like domain-containing protein n=1 Tax=Paenibacillus sp. GCM10023252 TaxID=3252649 RepID=UPI0036228EA6
MENCSVITKPALHLVGISYSGPYSTLPDEAIRLQSEFLARKHELDGAVKLPVLYSPYFGNEVFATYWACYEVLQLGEVPEGMVQFTIPEHRYAMAACSNKRIGEGYEQLHAWMNEMRLQKQENAVAIEIFYIDEQHLEEEPVELLIPLRDE